MPGAYVGMYEIGSATIRVLSEAEEVQENDFQAATTVAQIFSGIVFAGLGVWMLISNGTKFSYIQRASLEKRLGTCCAIDTYVALFSAFFNFFQLTEVDDLFLPRPGGFTLDFSRPVEWIVTCPMMQVVLVLMGGSRIPEYRRVLMPSLSLAVLACGTTSMLTGSPVRFIFYACGACIAVVMFSLNAKQIMEHSNDQENIWVGDSEFRKASVLLIVTWVPFPMWFFCSPEGVGLIDNILVIQMGWAFLNILSKFTFIFYIQRVKDNYCNRLKAKREMLGVGQGSSGGPDLTAIQNMLGIAPTNPLQNTTSNKDNELAAVVIETMTFLGMAQHNDRFLKLLRDAQVRTVSQVEELSKEESDKLQLPWDLVTALQKRIKVWRMEMTDNAELELERGEAHYLANTPRATDIPGQVGDDNISLAGGGPEQIREALMRAMANQQQTSMGFGGEAQQNIEAKLGQMEEMMNMMAQQQQQMMEMQMRRQQEVDQDMSWKLEQLLQRGGGGGMAGDLDSMRLEQMISQVAERADAAVDNLGRSVMSKLESMQAAQVRMTTESEEKSMQRIGSLVQKATEAAANEMSNTISAKMDMEKASQLRAHSEMEENLMSKLDNLLQRNNNSLIQKLDNQSSRGEDKLERIESQLQRVGSGSQSGALPSDSMSTMMAKLDRLLSTTDAMEGNLIQHLGSVQMGSAPPASSGGGSMTELEKSLNARMENLHLAQVRQVEENMRRKVDEVFEQAIVRVELTVQNVHSLMQADLGITQRGNSVVSDAIKSTGQEAKENLADLRRISLLILEQSSACLDRSNATTGKIDVVQGSIDTGIGRILDRVQELNVLQVAGAVSAGRASGSSTPQGGGGQQWPQSSGGSDSRRPSVGGSVHDYQRQLSKYSHSNING